MTDSTTWGLATVPAKDGLELLAPPVAAAILAGHLPGALVTEIDPGLADTAAMSEAYDVPLEAGGNCVVITGRRGGEPRTAACVVLATTRADVNNTVRRRLDVRKASFMSQDEAVAATGMEYGGITPAGLPEAWPVLVDARVTAVPYVIVGSGVRRSKLLVPGSELAGLPGAEVVEGLAKPV
ncbi:MAG: hypothetical protein GEV11_07790 [Streptosporangiales bacterium]|nr:hypothetical protein [Streptosporangiales bacterium]